MLSPDSLVHVLGHNLKIGWMINKKKQKTLIIGPRSKPSVVFYFFPPGDVMNIKTASVHMHRSYLFLIFI